MKPMIKAGRHKILENLHSISIHEHLAFFIKNFREDRNLKIRINNTYSKSYEIENRVPQGLVLSTLLFILLIDSVHKVVHRPVSL